MREERYPESSRWLTWKRRTFLAGPPFVFSPTTALLRRAPAEPPRRDGQAGAEQQQTAGFRHGRRVRVALGIGGIAGRRERRVRDGPGDQSVRRVAGMELDVVQEQLEAARAVGRYVVEQRRGVGEIDLDDAVAVRVRDLAEEIPEQRSGQWNPEA